MSPDRPISSRLPSAVCGLLLFSFVFFLFSSTAQAASKCTVGQCWTSKYNPTCPAGWQPVSGSCTTANGPGICCSEGAACPVGQCFADEYGMACPTGYTGYAGSCNTTSNPPKQGHCCQEGAEVGGGSGGGGGAAAWDKANKGAAAPADLELDTCFCIDKNVFDQQCTKLGGKLGSAKSSTCGSNQVCCDNSSQGNASGQKSTPAPGGMTNLGCEATGDCEIKDLVAKAVMFAQFLMGLSGALFLFAFVYGGAMYIIAFGRTAYIEKGKKAMIQASIGMLLIMGAWTIVTYLVSSLGAKI